MRSHVALWVQREQCESRRVAGHVGGRPGKRGRYEAWTGQHGRRPLEQGCDKWAQAGGLCIAHGGGKQKPCSVEGCGTLAASRGVCVKHGGGNRKPCSVEGCGTLANSKGLCVKHGGGKPCSVEDCGKQAQSGNEGMCRRHFKEMN